jgi:cytochrome c biogenesis protein CcmG/thiol:disulfide interchange protein DsbE
VKRLFYVIPVVVVIGLMISFAIFLQQGPATYIPSQFVGKTAPDIALPPLDSENEGFARDDLGKGQPIVINYWASWCGPCRIEHPALEALAARPGVTVYGVNYRESLYGKTAKDARDFLNELGNPFSKINQDEKGRVSIDWGVSGVPETFVVDGNGIIRVHYAGPLSDDVVERVILPALKQ